jgi:hypothetical protein
MPFTLTITIHGAPVRITGTYHARRGACIGKAPEDCHPEDPAEMEIITATIGGIDVYDLLDTLNAWGDVEEALWEMIGESA